MKKNLSIEITVDANTGAVYSVRNSFDKLDRKVRKTSSSIGAFKGKLLKLASAAIGLYTIKEALEFVISTGWEYNKALDASKAKLYSMISAGYDYVDVSGKAVTAQERAAFIAAETARELDLLKKTNAETAMGMQELIDVYALAKPGMDRFNWSLKDQMEVLKLVTNTASNFGVTSEELATGIDDLAAGTWDASSGFGKMMKAVGVTPEAFQKAANKVEFLKKALKETGATQDTLAVATSNLGVAWDELTGKITQPIFDSAKEGVKEFTKWLNSIDPSSIETLRDITISFIKVSVKGAAYVIETWRGFKVVLNVIAVAWNKFWLFMNQGLDSIVNGSIFAINSIYKAWIGLKNYVKQIWHDIVTYAAKAWNELIKSFANSKVGKFIADKFGMDLGGFSVKVEPVKFETPKDIVQKVSFDDRIDYWKKELINSKMNEIDAMNDVLSKSALKSADELIAKIDKIAEGYKKAGKEGKGVGKGIQLARKKIEDANKSTKKHTKSLKGANKAAKDHAKALKSANKEAKKLVKSTDSLQDKLESIVSSGIEDIFKGNIGGGLSNILSGVGKELMDPLIKSASSSVSGMLSNLAGGISGIFGGGMVADFLTGGLFSIGSSIVGSLFANTKLSEEEIAKAAGRSGAELTSKALIESQKILKDTMQPQMSISRDMLMHLESMDKNLASAVGGLQMSKFEPKSDSGFLGMFATSEELIGHGIEFARQSIESLLKAPLAREYQAIKETNSGIFGLFGGESIKNNYMALTTKTANDLKKAFNDGFDAIFEAVDTLGFNAELFKQKIQKQVVDLGRVNFKDLTQEQQAEALNKAFSEALGNAVEGALGSVATPLQLESLREASRAGEEYVQTLIRVASEFDYVYTEFMLFGQSVESFTQSNALVEAVGGLKNLQNAMGVFIKNFFSPEEQREMQRLQLQMALFKYKVTIPANKAEFRSLVLSTQQKLMAVQAEIDARKAEIIAAGSGSKALAAAAKARISINNALIGSSNQAGEAVVGFGNNMFRAVKAMTDGSQEAVKVNQETQALEIDWDAINDPILNRLEAEKSRLSGLYNTLMSNMSGFADYYGGVESASNAAAEAMSSLEKRLLSLAKLKAAWGDNAVEAAEIKLKAVYRYTKLYGVNYENFLNKLESYGEDISDKTLEKFQQLSSALKELHNAQEQARKSLEGMQKDLISFEGLWSNEDPLITAKKRLAIIQAYNDLPNLTYDTFYDAYLQAKKAGMSKKDFKKWKELGDALRDAYSVEQKRLDTLDKWQEKMLDFGEHTVEQRLYSIESAIAQNDIELANKAFDALYTSVSNDGFMSKKEKVFALADANNRLREHFKNANDKVVVELVKLNKNIETAKETWNKIEFNTDRISRNTKAIA